MVRGGRPAILWISVPRELFGRTNNKLIGILWEDGMANGANLLSGSY
jgi:hypothetical protein